MPQPKNNEVNSRAMNELETLCRRFRSAIEKANNPLNFGCFRWNIFGLYFKNIFHSNDQTENMLMKNFDGRRFWVKARDGVKLDCMFFPFNEEKVMTINELKEELKGQDIESQNLNPRNLEYLKYPTVIFFSPNA